MSMRSVSVFLAAATSATADEVSVKVNIADPTSMEIPSDFASLSTEPFCAGPYFANKDYTPRKQFVNLMKNLHTTSNGPKGPNIRVGGGTTLYSLYNWPKKLPTVRWHNITKGDVKAFSYADMWSGSITLDVQINSTSEILENTKLYVGEVLQQLGPVLEAFEIGNEPMLHNQAEWDTYAAQWEVVAEAIREVTKSTQPRIQGGTLHGCDYTDARPLPEYLKNFTDGPSRNYLKAFSHHLYRICGGWGPRTTEELMDELLKFKEEKGITHSVSSLKEMVAQSREAGVTFNIGEGNTHNLGGVVNVSNTFGSALWAVDSMLEAASLNISRWNFHGCPGPIPVGPHLSRTDTMAYSPIMSSTTNPDVLEALPVYYGMWLFTALTALDSAKNQARMLKLEYVNPDTNPHIRVSATGTPQVARFVAIHKDYKQTEPATVRIDIGAAHAGRTVTVKRMYPKSKDVFSTYGINFAGQTLDGTTDGIPIGTPTHEKATVGPDGSLTLSVDPVSMVLAELEL